MSSLDNILDNLNTIESHVDIEKAVEYSEKINGPLMSYKDYKILKEELVDAHYNNNSLFLQNLGADSYLLRENRRIELSNLTEKVLNIKEEYEDDFI